MTSLAPIPAPLPVTIDDVRQAAANLRGQIVETPTAFSRTLSQVTGARVHLKFENQQFTASFKDRGACYKLQSLSEAERRAGVIAVSAGNHAQGVAYHAARLGIPATIVMPRNTPFVKVRQTREHGARVVLEGEILSESFAAAKRIGAAEGLMLIHPFDDTRIIAGQGTVALEMLAEFPDLDCLVVPIGGGGLIAGVAIAAKAHNPGIEIIGVETALYPSMYHAMRGEPAQCGGATIAEGIAVKDAGQITLAICRELVAEIMLVSDADLERAIGLLLAIEKTVVEGAGAAGLAALLANPQRFSGKRVGLVLTGGNIDPRLLGEVIRRNLVREGRIAGLRVMISDSPGTLAKIASLIGEGGGNILEVSHQRLFLDVPVKNADLDLVVETRDAAHLDEIIASITTAGYPVRRLRSTDAAG
ncbi:threonine ammonia-lyase [Oleomonas cavernae]|uniref:L-serine dehydratase n=1 Tax=Oleomonas cavernae TaxID=2320859 RepID=A0A418WC94_9PROT|nr:threonine ammonia-lyase [Oleomonas cavernae]RJF87645.1 threonine ammonia-lyase [Oleomonas cavernae]